MSTSSEPPPSLEPAKKAKIPRIAQKAMDEAFEHFNDRERRWFMRLAKNEIVRGFRKVKNAEKLGPFGHAEAVHTLLRSVDLIDGMCDRRYKRMEPWIKLAHGLDDASRNNVTIVQIGQYATSPAMQLVLGPPPAELISNGQQKEVVDSPAQQPNDSTEISTKADGNAEDFGSIPEAIDWG